ncbi:MAG TPA: hypothetical protein VMU13_00495 [Candidatus Paceibacterota bacterium]|nr:hypothetical protein [Candidatus Paceibacterota bacterium]
MQYRNDKQGSKVFFFFLLIVIVYAAFFNFNIPAAYTYTISSVGNFFH